uniref:Uncharacterized protein n=1 Tax=Salvator merianae TaxID=96440 RepID=A0A8D0KDZ7_SALMN
MKAILSNQTVNFPEKIGVALKGDFNHINMELSLLGKEHKNSGATERSWQQSTQFAIVQNMIKGVTLGIHYKMRSVCAHFLFNMVIQENGSLVEIWNIFGETYIRKVSLQPYISCEVSQVQKGMTLNCRVWSTRIRVLLWFIQGGMHS